MCPPTISEKNFTKLVKKVTVGVEFSFNGIMYQQVDGVAMGSPLGPVLANIFVGHQEQKIPQLSGQLLYKRYVDDSLSISTAEEENEKFLKVLNSLHPALQYTRENENDGKLPFLDILVKKAEAQKGMVELMTTIYRKPTFTGQYTRWDSFSARSKKINLIKSLTHRAVRICSPPELRAELDQVRSILLRNGYPASIVDNVILHTKNGILPSTTRTETRKPTLVYLTLPWKGTRTSTHFERKIKAHVSEAFPHCKAVVSFSSKAMFRGTIKDRNPTHQCSNLIYLFKCRCDKQYVGKTIQRLETRIGQHIPAWLTKPKTSTNDDDEQPKVTSAIGEHLLNNTKCLDKYDRSMFSIVCRARTSSTLHVLEPLFIKKLKPELCKQMEFVKCLDLFPT